MSIYTESEKYIIECYKKSKHPSNRKISNLGGSVDYKKLYECIYNEKPPKCAQCNNDARFISLKKGFGRFCSKVCHSKYLSNYNKEHNCKKAIIKKEKLFQSRHEIFKKIESDYINNSTVTIDQLTKKYKLPKGAIRAYLAERNLTDPTRSLKARRNNLKESFKKINEKLDDAQWVNEKINEGWCSKNFAEYLNCSKNYICDYLRKANRPLEFGITSSYEIKLYEFIKSLGVTVIKNDRSIIHPYELDLYLPNHNLAIEINGLYWHNDQKKNKNYHLNKTKLCEEKGIQLLHFYDSEIDNKWQIVKSIIQNYLHVNHIVYAKSCSVLEIKTNEYQKFCEENHIQGFVGASIKLGLFYEEKLIAVMSFSKSRYDKTYEYELIRYCGLLGYNIVGGASKLYKSFCKKYQPNSIISYAQRRLFSGRLYENLGMSLIKTSPPNYLWINKYNDVLSRYQTQKHKITDKADLRTENEILCERGYHKIYDCGQFVYSIVYK